MWHEREGHDLKSCRLRSHTLDGFSRWGATYPLESRKRQQYRYSAGFATNFPITGF